MADMTNNGLQEMAAANGKSLRGTYFEIDDPSKVENASGGLDPVTRKKIFEKWGASQLPVTYVRPEYKEDGSWKMDQKYLLMTYPLNSELPDPQATRDYLVDVHVYLTGHSKEEVEKSPEIAAMARQLGLDGYNRIPVPGQGNNDEFGMTHH